MLKKKAKATQQSNIFHTKNECIYAVLKQGKLANLTLLYFFH